VADPYASYVRELYQRWHEQGGDAESWLPTDPETLERDASAALSEDGRAHLFGVAGIGATARANRAAFNHWQIVPRVMRNVAARTLDTELLGRELPAPLLLAPIGVQTLIHPDGELASAAAAATLGLPFVASTMSSFPLEEIAEANGAGPRWFQLYWPTDDAILESFVARAERAGYDALVLTVDCFIQGFKPADMDAGGPPGLRGLGNANFFSDPAFREQLAHSPEHNPAAANDHYLRVCSKPSLTWRHFDRLRQLTKLPLIVKGIQHPDDARQALIHGADALICSNHGGRQIDGAIASLDALPSILRTVDGAVPVIFDSGVRTGADAFKALALGAAAVAIGRPYLYGLALAGERGVEHVLRCLLAELDLTLALSGHTRIKELTPAVLTRGLGAGQ
jgi:L-lactate dehydrogenase (cytochrome)